MELKRKMKINMAECYLLFYLVLTLYALSGIVSGSTKTTATHTMLKRSATNTRIVQGSFSRTYTYQVGKNNYYTFVFSYEEMNATTTALRVETSSDANYTHPVMVVVRQSIGLLSWKLPLTINYDNLFHYDRVSRTPCPLDRNIRKIVDKEQSIYIDVTSLADKPVAFSLTTSKIDNFTVRTDEAMDATIYPSGPMYFMYRFPDDINSVRLRVSSDDSQCMILSVQDIKCPVFDLEDDVDFQGKYQTMTKQAAILLKKSDYEQGGFYIVMVLKSHDKDCDESATELSTNHLTRYKNVTFEVNKTISAADFAGWIALTVVLFFMFWIIYFIVIAVYIFCCGSDGDGANHGVEMSGNTTETRNTEEGTTTNGKRKRYLWNLLTIGVFYGLPVAQLVVNYQKTTNKTGDQDICYYNFYCAHPLIGLTSFNNVFSNIGYIMLGILFMVIIKVRSSTNAAVKKVYGNDLFYAMGFALIMEGIMSGCYHVCPNNFNFQFDTSFMYIIACLMMLAIFQIRNRDARRVLNKNAHLYYLSMAAVIFIAFIGVMFRTAVFWIIFGLIHIVAYFVISLVAFCEHDLSTLCSRLSSIEKPNCRDFWLCNDTHGLGFRLLGALLNLSIAIYGFVKQPDDFATFLLAIFISNLGLLLLAHLVKVCCGGKCNPWVIISVIASLAFWIPAIHFFTFHLTSWSVTPARSREGNRDCMLLEFYDAHDVWHFLSAVALFFVFIAILLTEDDMYSEQVVNQSPNAEQSEQQTST